MNEVNVENPLVNVCVWLSRVVISGVCAKAFLLSLDKLPCTGTG